MTVVANKNYVVRHIADEIIIFPTDEKVNTLHGGIRINEVTEFIWNSIQSPIETKNIVSLVTEEYDVEYERVVLDVEKVIGLFVKLGLVSES